MATEREIGVRLRVTASGLEVLDDAGRKVRTLERDTQGAGAAMGGLERAGVAVGTALAAAFTGAAYAAARFGALAIQEAAGQERATAALNAQLQAQGRYSDALSLSLQAQASALQRVTTFADDAVLSAQAMLATFPKIGNDVLPRATQAATDLASALGTDLTQAAQTVGIALNDPAEGIQRLSRLGIRFSDDQKTVLESLVETGRGAEAQTRILDTLGERMGGRAAAAAQTYGGRVTQLRNAVGDLLEEFGNAVVKSDATATGFDRVREKVEELTARTAEYVEANRELIDQKIDETLKPLPGLLEDAAKWAELLAGAIGGLAAIGDLPVLRQLRELNLGAIEGALKSVASIPDTLAQRRRQLIEFAAGESDINNPNNPFRNVADGGRTVRRAARLRENADAIAALRAENLADGGFTPAGAFGDAFTGTGTRGFFVQPATPTPRDPKAGDRARRDAERAAADYERRAGDSLAEQERVRLALLDAQVVMRERAIDFAEQDLQLAQQAGASQQEQLRLAAQLDTLERARLTATRERLEAELAGLQQFGPVLSEQVVQLQTELQGVNAELARGPGHVRELATEVANARREATGLSDSFARAIDDLLASGESFDFGKVLRNVLQIDGTQILGDLFAGGAGKLGLQGDNVIELIGDGISKGFASVRDLFGGAAPAAAGVPSSFVGPPTAAEAAAASGGGTQAAAQAGAAAGSAAAAGYAAIIVAGIGALQGGFEAIDEERNKLGATQRSVLLAGAAGALEGSLDAIGFGGIGKSLGGAIRKGGAAGALAIDTLIAPLLTGGLPIPGLSLIAEDIFAGLGLFQPKTRGTVLKKSLGELFTDANLPLQRDVELGGRRGVRTVGIEASPDQATFDAFKALGFDRSGIIENNLLGNPLREAISRNPAVEQFRTAESLGIGAVFAQNPRDASVFANAITSNFQLLGVGADEARRQLLKLAQTAGVDLIGGLEELNKSFLQGQFTQLQLESSAAGLVKLFSADLPAAIDVAKIVADRTNAEGGINIAGVQAGVAGAVSAYGIRRRIEDTRLGFLDPRRQGEEIKRRIAELDVQLADSDLTYGQRQSLLEERADLGFRYVDYAGQRYSGARRRTEQEFGYGVAEGSASQLEDLGKSIKEPTEANTSATSANTTAIDRLTNAILKGVQGRLDVTFAGIPSEDAPAVIATIKRELAEFVKSPEFRAAVRKEGAAP